MHYKLINANKRKNIYLFLLQVCKRLMSDKIPYTTGKKRKDILHCTPIINI